MTTLRNSIGSLVDLLADYVERRARTLGRAIELYGCSDCNFDGRIVGNNSNSKLWNVRKFELTNNDLLKQTYGDNIEFEEPYSMIYVDDGVLKGSFKTFSVPELESDVDNPVSAVTMRFPSGDGSTW